MLIFISTGVPAEMDAAEAACRAAGHNVIKLTLIAELKERISILERCDGLYVCDMFCAEEKSYARIYDIPLFSSPPPLHPTEEKRPEQVHAFMRMIMKMYRLHLDKNADYSPANILATGSIGVTVRLWDKVARLMNLTGFKVEIASSEYVAPIKPKNESIEDTLIDTANYAIIARLLRDGDWGN